MSPPRTKTTVLLQTVPLLLLRTGLYGISCYFGQKSLAPSPVLPFELCTVWFGAYPPGKPFFLNLKPGAVSSVHER